MLARSLFASAGPAPSQRAGPECRPEERFIDFSDTFPCYRAGAGNTGCRHAAGTRPAVVCLLGYATAVA